MYCSKRPTFHPAGRLSVRPERRRYRANSLKISCIGYLVRWCTVPWGRSLFKIILLDHFCAFQGTLKSSMKGPPFGNRFLNNSWTVGLTQWIVYLHFIIFWHMQLYMSWYIISFFWLHLHFLNILYFFKYSCTTIFHRRNLCTFYRLGPGLRDDVSAVNLKGFQVMIWNLVGWYTVPWSRLLFKMTMLCQSFCVPWNFEFFNYRIGLGLRDEASALTL